MFLNSATLIRPLPLKARVLGYEGARILGEKKTSVLGWNTSPPLPMMVGKSTIELVTILLEICDSQNYDISYEIGQQR